MITQYLFSRRSAVICRSFFGVLFVTLSISLRAQFSLGGLVVLQIGNGTSSLSGTGNPLILNEYNTSGTLTFSVPVPSTGTNALALRGNATSEGYISRSSDGNYIVFGGYLQALPNTGTTALNSTAPSAVSRGIGLVDASGSYSLISAVSSGFAASDIRGATATSSNNAWSSSASQGLNYFGTASTPTNVENAKANLRATHIFNNQLYCSSQVTTAASSPTDIGVYSVGSGTPGISNQTVITVINTGASSQPGQFYFNSAGTICYVADARNSSGGGVQKWVYSSGTWSLAYTLSTGTAAIGAFGVVADFSGFVPMVYATTTESSANRLIAIKDIGAASTATTLATASTSNTIFRGLAFGPVTTTCVAAVISTVANNSPICSSQALTFFLSSTGSAPVTYSWVGQGVFSSTAVANPTVTNAATGAYTVLISNACGASSTAVNVSVNITPTVAANAATICPGGTATLSASGASSYIWSNGANTAGFTASPTVTTTYTVFGSSSAGCVASAVTTTVTVVSTPSLTVNSATICVASSATLNASGVSTYTWSTNQNSASIVVSPSATTSYTVSGNISGCPVTVSVTATVNVNPLPAVSLSIDPAYCINQGSVALSGSPVGGTYSGTCVSGSVFTPTSVGTYSVTYSYTDANSCTSSTVANFAVSYCAGINELLTGNTLPVYPNPVKDILIVNLPGNEDHSIIISDALSRKVVELYSVKGTTSIDLSSLPAGIYFLRANNSKPQRVRFIKE